MVDVDAFIEQGFVRLPGAFPRAVADTCRAIWWSELGLSPDDPSEWRHPVIRLGSHHQAWRPSRRLASPPRATCWWARAAGCRTGASAARCPCGSPCLAPHGDDGAWFGDVEPALPASTHDRELAHATGEAGDVYLCHPFLLHAAQRHAGGPGGPRFLAQPPLLAAGRYDLGAGSSPVEVAIRRALGPA